MPPDRKHYRAFISYSHKDAKWATWLHRSLERYVVPIDAYPPEERPDKKGSKKKRMLAPVFRDRDELSAAGSLADTIREALESSENLIVLCSPESSASQYVNAEIELFRSLHPDNEKKIYALIIEGEPPGCFPPELTTGGIEPIAADAREEGDGKGDAKLKLIAGMLGVGFDRLKRREVKRQRNRLLAMVAMVSAVAVMASTLALWALKAERESSIMEKASRARILAETDPVKALALALDTAEEEKSVEGVVSIPVISSLLHTLETGRETARYSSAGGYRMIVDCKLSPDGKKIAYAVDREVFLVDRESGLSRLLYRASDEVMIRRIAFNPESKLLAIGDEQGMLSVVRIDGQEVLWQIKAYESSIIGLDWLAGNGQIVSCSGSGVVSFWNDEGQQSAGEVSFKGAAFRAFAVSPDGKVAAAAASEMNAGDGAWMLDCKSGQSRKLETGEDVIRTLAFDASGERLAGAGVDRSVRFWNIQGQPLGGTIRTGHEASINCLAFHPYEPLILTGSEDGTLRAFTESGNRAFSPLHGHSKLVRSVSFDKAGANVVSAGDDFSVRTWDLVGLQVSAPIHVGINSRALLFHPDGSKIAVGSMDGKIRVYDYPSGELIRMVEAHPGTCDAMLHMPDGKGLISASYSANEVRLFSWEGESNGEVFRDPGGRIYVMAVDSKNTQLLVQGEKDMLHQLALPSLKVLNDDLFAGKVRNAGFFPGLAILEESHSLLLRGGNFINIRRLDDPQKVLVHDDGLWGPHKFRLAFSPDRKFVVTAGQGVQGSSLLNVYSLPKLELERKIKFPWKEVHIATYGRSGRELALVSDGGQMQFFSAIGVAIGPVLRAHDHDPRGFARHPGEDVFMTAGGDGWIRFWGMGENEWMKMARIRLGRAKAGVARSSALLSRAASRILSRKSGGSQNEAGGRVVFPEAGISLEVPEGWVQFDPRALNLTQKLVGVMGGDQMKRLKIKGAFSRGDEVQFRIFGAPNFYVGLAEELRGMERLAEQLPEFQSKVERLLKSRGKTLGLASEIEFGDPTWNSKLRVFQIEGGGKANDGHYIGIKTWLMPTRSHVVMIASMGNADLVREVEDIMQTIEITSELAPEEEAYARAGEILEKAILERAQNQARLEAYDNDMKQSWALSNQAGSETGKGNFQKALELYEEALGLSRKWTKGEAVNAAHAGESFEVLNKTYHLHMEGSILQKIANIHLRNKDDEKAKTAVDQALKNIFEARKSTAGRSDPRFQSLAAYCLRDKSRISTMRGDPAGAVAWMKKAVKERRNKNETDPRKNADGGIELANTLIQLSDAQFKNGDLNAAISSAKEAIEVVEGIPKSVRSRSWPKNISGYYKSLSSYWMEAGNRDEEVKAAEMALKYADDARTAFSNTPRSRWQAAEASRFLVLALNRRDPGNFGETIPIMEKLTGELAAIRSVAKGNDLQWLSPKRVESDRRGELAGMLWRYAEELRKKGESDELELRYLDQAVGEAEEAVNLSEGFISENCLQEAYRERGGFFNRTKRYDLLVSDREKRVEVFRRIVSKEKEVKYQIYLASALRDFAAAQEQKGELVMANKNLDEARGILESVITSNPDELRARDLMLAVSGSAILAADKLKDFEKVEALRNRRLELANEMMEKMSVETVPLVQVFYAYFGEANYRRSRKIGEPEHWIALCEKAIEAIKQTERDDKLTSSLIKSRDDCLMMLEKLRVGVAQ